MITLNCSCHELKLKTSLVMPGHSCESSGTWLAIARTKRLMRASTTMLRPMLMSPISISGSSSEMPEVQHKHGIMGWTSGAYSR